MASEVRNLALRSAEAAQEIRKRISTSEQAVATGVTQSARAEHLMQQLLDSAHAATASMSEIVAATQQQSMGIADITQSMASIEASMSQNAALAEQSSAASSAMREQTARMAQSVRTFH